MNELKVITVESGHKIALPVEWAVEFHLEKIAALEKTAEGILVRPCSPITSASWDEVFAEKLPLGQHPMALDLSELSGDDLLF